MENADADIMCFGHTHKPYHRILNSVTAIITLDKNSSVFKRESIGVEFVRVKYDVERAAEAIENSDLPHVYAQMLRKAH